MIQFNKPPFVGPELDYMKDAFARRHVSGDGYYGRKAEQLLAEGLGVRKVLLTTSCTHALEMSAMLLDIVAGDEVIVPAFTFVSTVNAFVLRGAKPVFADIRPDTLNLDEALLPSLVTERTKAIVPVHYAGVACDMDAIGAVASPRGIPVVEDNAHGLYGTFRGKPLGTFGALATQSFHETKNFSCGEGGALLVNDASLVERAEILREKGTNRSRFFRGQVDKYTWVDIGSSYVLSDLLGAALVAQLEAREAIQTARRRIWERYAAQLGDWAAKRGVRLPVVPAGCEQTFHMFHLLLPDLAARTAFIAHLKAREVHAVFHYMPLHLSPMGARYGGREGQCPVTERVSDQLVRLPLHMHLTEEEQSQVIDAVRAF
jgi:dTDP-4-amino-4,6-dideoxygalactose transaminase